MKLKQLMAGATIAGALGAAALGVGAGAASAAPGPQPGGHGAPAANHADPHPRSRAAEAATDRAGRADRAAPVDQAPRTRWTGRPRTRRPGRPR